MPKDTDRYDVFVSYARSDNAQGWVSGFIDALLAEHRTFAGATRPQPLEPFFDKKDIHSFDDWQSRIFEEGICRSRLFIAFLSPAYFASEWCRREWKAWIDTEIAKHILSQGAAPIYFVEVPGFVGKVAGLREQATLGDQEVARKVAELCGLPSPHDALIAAASPVIRQIRNRRQITQDFVQPFADAGLDALRREDLRRVLKSLAEDLDERLGRVRVAATSESTVPPYNRKFTGRLDELLELRKRLADDRAGVVCGVHGLGGIGKTELAFTYAHAFAHAYPGGRFLVPCDGRSSLREAALCLADFKDFHAQIGEQERLTPDRLFAAVCRCLDRRLEEKGHILLVLDNVTDTALVSNQQTGELTRLGARLHLLATTRQLPPTGARWLTLGQLPEADALDLLERHRAFADAGEHAAARRIVRRLGGFTLAIELLAAWLAAHPGSSYAALADGIGLDDLEDMAGDDSLELQRHNHERRLGAVLGPTLAGLPPADRRAMEYATLLPPDHVALPWLRTLVESDFPEALQPTRRIADPWRELWARLEKLALFSRPDTETSEPRLLRVHRLVQDLILRDLPEAERAARQAAVDALVTERDAALEKETHWQEAAWELEPFEALAWTWAEPATPGKDGPPPHPRAAWLLNPAGARTFHLAAWTRAEPLMRRALAIDEASFGSEHPNVARGLNNLAALLHATNRLAEAEPLMRRALAIFQASLGEVHPNVATELNNLAQVLQATNRLAEAEPLMRRALAIDEASFGSEHPNVAIRLNNLAAMLQDTNRLAEAEPLLRRHLEIFLNFTRATGHPHPHLQAAIDNYAGLLEAMGKSGEEIRRTLTDLGRRYGVDLGGVGGRAGNQPSAKLRAVLEEIMRDQSKLQEIAGRLQREDPALFRELVQFIQQQQE